MNRDDVPSENTKLKTCKENWTFWEFHSVMTEKAEEGTQKTHKGTQEMTWGWH